MKRVLVACGNGVATSTMDASKVREYLKENNIAAQVEQCKLLEIPSKQDAYDLIIATGKYDNTSVTKPVISGMPLLTGIGATKVLEEVKEKLL